MNIDIENEILLMIKYNLTAEEMLIIKLIFLIQEDQSDIFIKFNEECEHTDIRIILTNLQKKGIFLKNQIKENIPINARTLEFNKNFIKNYLQHSYDLGMELLSHYPNNIRIENKLWSLKNISKHFKSYEDFSYNYGKAINFNKQTHEKILQILDNAKESDLIHYGICEFVISRKWIELEEQLKNGLGVFQTGTLL